MQPLTGCRGSSPRMNRNGRLMTNGKPRKIRMCLEGINTLAEKLADETERRGWEAPVQLKALFQGADRKCLICKLGAWRLEPGTH